MRLLFATSALGMGVDAPSVEHIIHITSPIGINLLVVYRESVNLIGYITRRLSAVDSYTYVSIETSNLLIFN